MAKKKKNAEENVQPVTAEAIDGEALENIPMADEAPAEPTMTETVAEQATSDETVSRETTEEATAKEEQFGMATLSDADASELFEISEDYKKLGLYLHIPFCKSKCAYCDFYSTDKLCANGRRASEAMKAYVHALRNHMRIISERTTQHNVDTIFIGGGTPTALPAKLLLDVVKEVKRCFYLDENYEFTVEMNPATANKALLKSCAAQASTASPSVCSPRTTTSLPHFPAYIL